MNRWSHWVRYVALAATAAWSCSEVAGGERRPSDPNSSSALASVTPSSKVVDSVADSDFSRNLPAAGDTSARLQFVLTFARDAYARISQEVHDYECQLVKRERVEGTLGNYQYLFLKVRHEKQDGDKVTVPFSVFLRFLKPERMEGREVLYIENANHGDLIARRGGRRSPNMTVQLPPESPMAMDGNRYPITEIGFQNLTKRLIEVLEKEQEHNDGQIDIFPNAKVDDRKCTHFRLTHHQPRAGLTYHMAEVSVDNELKIPIYFRSFDWPAEEGGKPRLLEEYFYKHVRLNVGLTDRDFDRENPDYHFQRLEDADPAADDPDAAAQDSPPADEEIPSSPLPADGEIPNSDKA